MPSVNLADLQPDERNANKGTERGLTLLEKSLKSYGAGRSILVDRDNRVIAGGKTLGVAVEMGLGVREVETDGRELVVVRRTDLSMDDRKTRELAIADNRVAELDLDWDLDALRELAGEGVGVSEFFLPDELPAVVEEEEGPQEKYITLTFDLIEHAEFQLLINKLKEKNGMRNTAHIVLAALRAAE